MATLAEIFVAVRPDTSRTGVELKAQLGKVDTEKAGRQAGDNYAKGFGSGTKKLIGLAAGALVSKQVVGKVRESITAASDLNETVSKTQVIFGSSAKDILKFSKTSSTALGQTQKAALDANATFGIFGKSAGLQGKRLTGFTTQFTTLASDLASFHNTSPEQAIEALGAAFRGEAEPMRAYGVLLDDASMRQEAMRLGIIKSTKTALTPQQKVLAAQALILKQTKDAQGDFARTSGGLANQQRIQAAQTDRLKLSIGKGLLPAQLAYTQLLNTQLLPALIQLADRYGPKVETFMTGLGPKVAASLSILKTGDFNGTIRKQLGGLEEDSGYVTGLLRIRDGLTSVHSAFSILASGNFTGRIFGQEEDSKFVDFLFKVRDGITQTGTSLKTFDTSKLKDQFGSVVDSVGKLLPLVGDLRGMIPGLTDVVGGTVGALAFLADHTETIRKLLPLIAAGFIAYKIAQAASNAAALLSVPIKISEIAVNRSLVKSNRELIASRAGDVVAITAETVATGANTGAKSAGILATLRQRAASIAHAIATRAIAAATIAWTGVQWLLNAALSANPIGLVILAAAGLALGFLILWKRSETFRTVVTAAFTAIKSVAISVIQVVWNVVSGFFGNLLTGAAKAFGWVPTLGPKLQAAASWFGTFRDSVNNSLSNLKDQEIKVGIKYSAAGVNLSAPSSVGRSATGGKISGPGTETSDSVLRRLSIREWVIKARSSKMYGDKKMAAVNAGTAKIIAPGEELPGFAAGGRPGLNVRTYGPDAARYASDVSGLTMKLAGPFIKRGASQVAPPVSSMPGGGSGVARWRNVALAALAAAGAPASWLPSLLRRMNQESGGNPNIQNNWDSNAAAGTPSIGLMQTIGPTFAAYAGRYRSRGIRDPFANIYASIKYAVARYGSGPAGWDRKGGYAQGGTPAREFRRLLFDTGQGYLPTGTSVVQNNTGRPEPLTRTDQAMDLSDATIRDLGRVFAAALARGKFQLINRGGSSYVLQATNG